MMLQDILFATSVQKVLSFLLLNPEEKFYDREVSRRAKVGRAATNYSLRALMDAGLIRREKKGRMYFYYASTDDPLIRELKRAQNLVYLRPLIDELKECAVTVTLFGSFARGTNRADSDIDLFVLSRNPQKVKELILKSPIKARLQYVINTPQEFARLKRINTVFHKEISSGMVLHEETP